MGGNNAFAYDVSNDPSEPMFPMIPDPDTTHGKLRTRIKVTSFLASGAPVGYESWIVEVWELKTPGINKDFWLIAHVDHITYLGVVKGRQPEPKLIRLTPRVFPLLRIARQHAEITADLLRCHCKAGQWERTNYGDQR